MKRFYPSFLAFTLSSLFALGLNAQNATSYQLATPDNLSSFFLGSFLQENEIYYGADPGNSTDNPVIVYVHGFTDLSNLWFLPGNELYEQSYDNNYRTAFVAMTRGGGMWENGELLSYMLEDITAHYGVSEVVIVAHSNGGKASEVAMFHHGKKDLVNRVISLGTPFYGTELADLSQTFWFRWLVDFVGLGEGAATSTTYYMEDVARPYLDGLSNNEPEKFFNFGAWGYNSGTTIFAPAMLTTGLILNANGSGWFYGGNDGVTPYWSSTRPGALPIWTYGYGNPISAHDHIDVALDFACWDEMEPYFTGPLGTYRSYPSTNNRLVRGDGQYLSSEAGQTEFVVEKGGTDIIVNIIHQAATDQFSIVNEQGESLEVRAEMAEGNANYFASNFTFAELPQGRYSIQSSSEFSAIINYDNGTHLIAKEVNKEHNAAYKTGEVININLSLENAPHDNVAEEVVAFVTKTVIPDPNNFEQSQAEESLQIVELKPLGDNDFELAFDGLDEGLYNVMVMANGSKFAKSLVTGFAVQANKTDLPNSPNTIEMALSPNPVRDQLNINLNELNSEKANLSIFDAYGRMVFETTITRTTNTLKVDDILPANGTYYLRITDGTQQVVKPFVKF